MIHVALGFPSKRVSLSDEVLTQQANIGSGTMYIG